MNTRDNQPRDLDRPAMPPMPHMGEILRRAGEPLAPERRAPSGVVARQAEPQPMAAAPQPQQRPDPLAELARLISEPNHVPRTGVEASKAMAFTFDTVANDVVAAAKDGVDRANLIYQEAVSYAEILRRSGQVLCESIEAEASRAMKLSIVMREAKKALAGPNDPPSGD